ncbi:MAG: NAD(P)H-dependent glycerol-3-phosphate dehydrogenase [Oscillospiraceae bacterium]|nr:NAD(P)H-dependent glycerol-3-phosphate dehydrogenase [Oscillospiraceae bacterium]
MAKITVLGAGGFGTALAIMLDKYGNDVTIWSVFQHEIDMLETDREHKKLLPGVKIADSIKLTTDKSCVSDKDIVIVAVPSDFVRSTLSSIKEFLSPNTIITLVSKGLEDSTMKRLSQVCEEEITTNKCVVLSGPSHAEEVSRGIPTTVVVASKDEAAAEYVQETVMNPTFRIYVCNDIVGVELGAALKNVIALAAGITDGMGLGDNTKAALMTRGIKEITKLGIALGGKLNTFAGLSGIGDLIVTCTSMHSRNRRCGILIGQGKKATEAIAEIGMTVEGYRCARCAYELSKQVGVEMPIIEQVYKALYEDKSVKDAISELMQRPKKHEHESNVL